MGEFHKACKVADLVDNKPLAVTVDDEPIIIVKTGKGIFALEDNCSHQDFPLCHGKVEDGKIRCKMHGAEFCLESGKALRAPAFAPVRSYKTKVENDTVFIEID